MQDRIVIFGCGGHAKAVLDVVLTNNDYEDIVFVDEQAKPSEKILNFPVVENYNITNEKVFVAIGNNAKRETLCKKYYNNLKSVISKNAYIGNKVKIGKGVFVAHGVHVGIFSILEDFCIINTNASVDHECIIKKSAFIGPNTTLCGKVDIGEKSFLGAGVIVKDKISICGNCTIGAGGVVVKDIIQKATYVGVPVKSMGV